MSLADLAEVGDGKCCLKVDRIAWHTTVDVFAGVGKGFTWADYERGKGQSDADWYYRGIHRSYEGTVVHEETHRAQFEAAAAIALPQWIDEFEEKHCYRDRAWAERMRVKYEQRTIIPLDAH